MVYYLLHHNLNKILETLNECVGLYEDFMLLYIIVPYILKFWTSKYLFCDVDQN